MLLSAIAALWSRIRRRSFILEFKVFSLIQGVQFGRMKFEGVDHGKYEKGGTTVQTSMEEAEGYFRTGRNGHQ